MIHPTAIIHSTAKISEGVEIGPETIIEKGVTIGEGTRIGARVVIRERTQIGKRCQILEFAKVGEAPQGFAHKRKKTFLVMGDDNIVREGTILNRGTVEGGAKTTIGHGNLFMTNSRVGHDCTIGNHVVLAIGSTLSGHNTIGDHVVLGGLATVDQRYQIGSYALITARTNVFRDVPPYMLASGSHAGPFELNIAVLKHHGFSEKMLKALEKAKHIIFESGLTLKNAIKKLKDEELWQIPEVQNLIQFIQGKRRRTKGKVK